MNGRYRFNFSLAVVWLAVSSLALAQDSGLLQTVTPQQNLTLEHLDPITVDPQLSLPQLLEQTVEQYPDRLVNDALLQEANALKVRGEGWFAGSAALALDYYDDRVASDRGSRDASALLEFTPWSWGQRSAAQAVAERAERAALTQSSAIRLEVARLLREALWDMALAESRLQQAKINIDVSEKLLSKVRRRVTLGDLPRTDLLLAESDHLQNRSLLTQAEAEVMHSRKTYSVLTQTTRVPAHYQEAMSERGQIDDSHPFLEAINALLARKQASVEFAKTTDTINQPKINIGGRTSRDQRDNSDLQSAGIGVVIPFGHATYDAPEIAAAQLEVSQVIAQRQHLMRQLEKNLHEAEHALTVTRTELENKYNRQGRDVSKRDRKSVV